ncbi:GNAT family N-acetyltransferase [Demequina salsinemoris]|uniref:GNAT family N-acetyltransferase n=1 Tax=Demequina salsinemoris TaxID=577470 RepID=UPI000782169B|nr:GNAT family N-acetyltransferase [Demequina salsinemoris]
MTDPGGAYERIHMRAALADVVAAAPAAPRWRAGTLEDLDWQNDMAWGMYPARPPFESREALDVLADEMRAGAWGEMVPEASPVVLTDGGEVRGFVVTTRRLLGESAPDCPYVLDVVVAPASRRQGVAAGMLGVAASSLLADGEAHLALTVDADNPGALALYARLGFVETGRRVQAG